ncbi:MAG TPA: glycosyltransferase family 87 protein [Candidatus Binatia bacterium]|jgi:hypothetical protein
MNRIVAVAVGLLLGMTIFVVPELLSLGDAANPFADFAAFYTAAKSDWTSLYDLDRQYEIQSEFAPAPRERMAFYFYPPFFAALFKPLAWLTYGQAFAAMILFDLFLLALALTILIRHLDLSRKQRRWLIFTTFINFAVYFCLLKGQTSFISLLLLVLYVVAMNGSTERRYRAGIWSALLCFKPPLAIVPVVVLCVRRYWSALLTFATCLTLLGAISIARVGWSGIAAWLEISKRVASGEAMDYAHNHHNLRAIIYFLARSPVRDFIWVGVTALLFALIVAYARRPNSDSTAWAIIWIAAFVSAPYLHFYDLTLLILPAAFLIKSAEDLGAAVALGLITLNILFVAHASLGIPTLTSIPLLAFLLWMVVVDRPFAPAVALGNNAH